MLSFPPVFILRSSAPQTPILAHWIIPSLAQRLPQQFGKDWSQLITNRLPCAPSNDHHASHSDPDFVNLDVDSDDKKLFVVVSAVQHGISEHVYANLASIFSLEPPVLYSAEIIVCPSLMKWACVYFWVPAHVFVEKENGSSKLNLKQHTCPSLKFNKLLRDLQIIIVGLERRWCRGPMIHPCPVMYN